MKANTILSHIHLPKSNCFEKIITDRKKKVNDYIKNQFFLNIKDKSSKNSINSLSNVKLDNTKEAILDLKPKIYKIKKPLNLNSHMFKTKINHNSFINSPNNSLLSNDKFQISSSRAKILKIKSSRIKPLSPIKKLFAEMDIVHRNSTKKYYSLQGTPQVFSPCVKNCTVKPITSSFINQCIDNISESELLTSRLQKYKNYLWKKHKPRTKKKKKSIQQDNETKGLPFIQRLKIILQSKAIDKLGENSSFKYRELLHSKFKLKDFEQEIFNYPSPSMVKKDKIEQMKEVQEYHLNRVNQCIREQKNFQRQFDELHKYMLAQNKSEDNLLAKKYNTNR